MSNNVHSTAVISAKAELGEENSIGPFAIIEDDVVVGNKNSIAGHVVLKSGTRIGDSNIIQEHAVIAGIPQDLSFKDVISYVRIGNHNVIRESVTINRATRENEATYLGDKNFLMVGTHIAHDCRLGNQIVIVCHAALGGYINVEDKAIISGGVMVHQFSRIGSMAMIGGNSKITQDVLPYMITDGVPGCVRGLNVVGLRRNDFSADEIRALKQAYKVLLRCGSKLEEMVDELHGIGTKHAHYLAEFISQSKRGFHHPNVLPH